MKVELDKLVQCMEKLMRDDETYNESDLLESMKEVKTGLAQGIKSAIIMAEAFKTGAIQAVDTVDFETELTKEVRIVVER